MVPLQYELFFFVLGGQFTPARGGQFGPAQGGHIKPEEGGQYHRHVQLEMLLKMLGKSNSL